MAPASPSPSSRFAAEVSLGQSPRTTDLPVRVCYVLSKFHPHASGAERQALAQGVELVRRGHRVHVVTQAISGCPRDETIGGVEVHRWVRPIRLGPLFGITFVAGMVRALRRLRPEYDLIHTHQGLWEAISTGAGRSWLGGAPTLIQPASSGYYGEAEELARTKGFSGLRRLILRNTAFAAISADLEAQWLALGVPGRDMVRTVSGVDADHFRPGPSFVETSLPPRPRVVFTGRLHPQKNLDLLLNAWPAVLAATSATLVLVGDGPERTRLEAMATDLGIADRVVFAGSVADPAEYLRAADVFVLPSLAEGMSNSLLEAMATGLPCVASEIGGNTDLLGDGVGMLVPTANVSDWTEALVGLLEDRGRAGMMGEAARRRIEETYSLPRVVDRYLVLYQRLLAGLPINEAIES
jgi:glycosyltransferase involved in cell wall biosynthesis